MIKRQMMVLSVTRHDLGRISLGHEHNEVSIEARANGIDEIFVRFVMAAYEQPRVGDMISVTIELGEPDAVA